MKAKNQKQSGYIAMMSMLVIGAAGVVVATTLLLSSINSTRNSASLISSNKAKSYANTCAESALMAIRNDSTVTGTVTNSTFGDGSCSYTIIKSAGEARSITITATSGNSTRKISVIISAINPQITVGYWQEVPETS